VFSWEGGRRLAYLQRLDLSGRGVPRGARFWTFSADDGSAGGGGAIEAVLTLYPPVGTSASRLTWQVACRRVSHAAGAQARISYEPEERPRWRRHGGRGRRPLVPLLSTRPAWHPLLAAALRAAS
jgi:hypothetical protein